MYKVYISRWSRINASDCRVKVSCELLPVSFPEVEATAERDTLWSNGSIDLEGDRSVLSVRDGVKNFLGGRGRVVLADKTNVWVVAALPSAAVKRARELWVVYQT